MIVRTPGGELPTSTAREAPDGMIWSVDGRRLLAWDSREAALELTLYTYRAFLVMDAAGARWNATTAIAGRSRPEQARRVLQLRMQAVSAFCVCLRLQAQAFLDQRLPVTLASSQLVQDGRRADWSRIGSDGAWTVFQRPEQWASYADEVESSALEAATAWGFDVSAARSAIPDVRVGFAAATTTVILVTVAAAAAIATAAALVRSRALRLQMMRAEMVAQRFACADTAIERYRRTGNAAELDILAACTEQAEIANAAADPPTSLGGRVLFGLAVAGAAWVALDHMRTK